MQPCLPNAQILAHMGLELADYEQMIGDIYESALNTRCLSDSLRAVRTLLKDNFMTLILRIQDEQLL